MEDAIHRAEAEVESRQAKVADAANLTDHIRARDAYEQLAAAQREVERLYARWAELEAKAQALQSP